MATSETARKINRGVLLDLIRMGQPLSRADLARQTGLQRSTVSLIVDHLIAERWVVEGDALHLPRGRHPRVLHLNSERSGVVGINVRPRSTTIALADLNLRFLAQETIPTGNDPGALVETLSERTRAVMAAIPGFACAGVGVSLPGRVDQDSQRLAFAPNLGWRDVDLKTPLERATGLPVQLENAANACALAEAWAGPHAGTRDLIAVTVSEGIGTGIIANGHLVRGSNGSAGEFGHVSLQLDGPECNCGNRGCWETYASNAAAVRNYIGRRRAGRGAAAEVEFEWILNQALQGDLVAGAVLEEMGGHLGRGIANLVSGFAPAVVLVVGEVTRAWDLLGPVVRREVQAGVRSPAMTRIVPADDATQPRLRGTIALVLQKYFRPGLLH